MDPNKFTGNRTGGLVKASTPLPDWAFVPEALPPRWPFPTSLYPLLIQARDRLATLNGIGRTLPDPRLLARPLLDREALTSSSLEGTYATPEDLILFAQTPTKPKSASDPANTWLEVHNYTRALNLGHEHLAAGKPLTLTLIRDMHHKLLGGVRGRERDPGEFRRMQVCVGHDRRYVAPPANYLPDQLDSLQKYMNTDDGLDPLVRSYLCHYQFEAIHPFLDGNGRIGRVLLALMIYRLCGHSMPWLYMSAFFERFKDEYIEKMFRVSANGEWTQWIEFCLRGTIEQANDAISRIEALKELQQKFHEKVGSDGSVRTHDIVTGLFSKPVFRITDIATRYNVAYATAKGDVQLLQSLGILAQITNYKPATYYCDEIMEISYRDVPLISAPPSQIDHPDLPSESEQPEPRSASSSSPSTSPPAHDRPSVRPIAREQPQPDSSPGGDDPSQWDEFE